MAEKEIITQQSSNPIQTKQTDRHFNKKSRNVTIIAAAIAGINSS